MGEEGASIIEGEYDTMGKTISTVKKEEHRLFPPVGWG